MNGEGFARALRSLEALEPRPGAPERTLDLAGARLRLRFGSPRLAELCMRALAHHEVASSSVARCDLTIDVVDRDTPGNPLSALPAALVDGRPDGGERVERWSYEGAAGRARLQEGYRVLYLWHRALGRAAVCFDDASAPPYYQIALPLLPLLGWVFAERGLAILHAAAIEIGGGAVLFGGRSGTGKSTTALACLDAGLGYLGDDLCLVEPGEPPMVHSLYCSAKLDPADTHRFPALAPALASPVSRAPMQEDSTRGAASAAASDVTSKVVYLFDRHLADRVVRRAPLLGVAIPRRGPDGPPLALSPGRAFLAMAPNTVFLLPGAARAAAAGVKALVTRVPVHVVAVGDSIADIVPRVREHARYLGSRSRRGDDAA